MGSPVAASRSWTVSSSPRDGDGPAVGAVGRGLDRAGVLAADPERMEPAATTPARFSRKARSRSCVAGEAGALQAADEPEQALGDVALLAEGLAVLVGQVGRPAGRPAVAATGPPRSASPIREAARYW